MQVTAVGREQVVAFVRLRRHADVRFLRSSRNDSGDINAGIPRPGLTHRMTAIALRGGFKAYFNRVNRATCDAVERSYSLAHPRELPGARLTYPIADCGLHPLQSPATRKQTEPPLGFRLLSSGEVNSERLAIVLNQTSGWEIGFSSAFSIWRSKWAPSTMLNST